MALLVDPFSEVVVFGKAYPVAWPPQGATSVKALLPTGRHVSHANRLHHTHNSRGGGGKATTLEHYTGRKSGGRTKLQQFGKGSVAEGLRMAGNAKGKMPLMNARNTKRVTLGPVARRMQLAQTRRVA
jgi:hypothetical protein